LSFPLRFDRAAVGFARKCVLLSFSTVGEMFALPDYLTPQAKSIPETREWRG
jgi:hypothetical protein